MSRQDNVDTFNAWIKAHQEHNIDKMLTFLTDDVSINSSAGDDFPAAVDKPTARIHWETIYEIFPDFHMGLVDFNCDEDVGFAEMTEDGTMKGKIGDLEPTGKTFHSQGAWRMDFKGGKIHKILSYWNAGGMKEQLGLLVPVEQVAH